MLFVITLTVDSANGVTSVLDSDLVPGTVSIEVSELKGQ